MKTKHLKLWIANCGMAAALAALTGCEPAIGGHDENYNTYTASGGSQVTIVNGPGTANGGPVEISTNVPPTP